MIDFFKRFFCTHNWIFDRNIYGDAINHFGGRSLWVCSKCGAIQIRHNLQ